MTSTASGDATTRSARVEGIRPLLMTADLPATIEFYTSKLGFEVTNSMAGDDGVPYWCSLRRDAVAVMFNAFHFHEDDDGNVIVDDEHPNQASLTGSFYVDVDDVDALYAEMAPLAGDAIEGPPEDMYYGLREFRVVDPNGYALAFCSHL